MTPSPVCVDLVKRREGLRLAAYRDPGGVLTIGYGHTYGVRPGDTISEAQADAMLLADLADAAQQVAELVTVPLTQGQVDALTSFVFNEGCRRFETSTLRRMLNGSDFSGAACQFRHWVYQRGRVLPGLVARRAEEAALFQAKE